MIPVYIGGIIDNNTVTSMSKQDRTTNILNSYTDNDILNSYTDNDILNSYTDNDILNSYTDNDILNSYTDNDILDTYTVTGGYKTTSIKSSAPNINNKNGGAYPGLDTELTEQGACVNPNNCICSTGEIKLEIAKIAEGVTTDTNSIKAINIVKEEATNEINAFADGNSFLIDRPQNNSVAEQEVLNIVLKSTKRKNEIDLLKGLNFKSIPQHKIDQEIDAFFKTSGPKHDTTWLSNYNLDETLMKWAIEYNDFYYCPFAMIDFEKTNILLNRILMSDVFNGTYASDEMVYLSEKFGFVKRPNKCFGCIINTDVSTGPGQHWMAIFVDMGTDPCTVEFFNSTGEKAQAVIQRWQHKQKEDIETNLKKKAIVVDATKGMEHQKQNSECGVYSLYYIRLRLEGKPIEYFSNDRIPDKHMNEFRTFLFR